MIFRVQRTPCRQGPCTQKSHSPWAAPAKSPARLDLSCAHSQPDVQQVTSVWIFCPNVYISSLHVCHGFQFTQLHSQSSSVISAFDVHHVLALTVADLVFCTVSETLWAPNTLAPSPIFLEQEQHSASQTRKAPRTKPLLAPERPASFGQPSTHVPACLPTALTVPALHLHTQIWQRQEAAAAAAAAALQHCSKRKLGPLQLPTLHQLCTRRQPDPTSSSSLEIRFRPRLSLCSTSHCAPHPQRPAPTHFYTPVRLHSLAP